MDRKRKPRGAALTDAERGGLSVLRENHATNEEIRKVAVGLVEKSRSSQGEKADQAGVFGVLRMPCSAVRASKAEEDSAAAYCVYDTAIPDTVSHAEAFQRVHGVEDGLREERRRLLFTAVKSEFISVEHFRDGLLADLAPRAWKSA
jgi:hypothetical protein